MFLGDETYMTRSTKAELEGKKILESQYSFEPFILCHSNAHKMQKMYLCEWKFKLKSFVFISVNVIYNFIVHY